MSCDNNEDLWQPFHQCMEKYWKDHPEIIYSTETKVNPYYKTICRNLPITSWTKRVVETIKDLPCRNILLMVDDIFLRQEVNNDLIWSLCDLVKENIAALNFEFQFDPNDRHICLDLYMRSLGGRFKLSCMCQLWQKKVMLDLFNVEKDPWRFEKDNVSKGYNFLISKNGNFLNWGKRRDDWHWGIVKGKWTQECKEFFEKEGIVIDYSVRGFID